MTRFRSAFVFAAAASALLPFSAAHAQKDAKPDAKPGKMDKTESPSQSSVAAKDKKFATVAASDAKVKAATDAKNLTGAGKFVSKTGVFAGTVAGIFSPKGNHLLLINFDKDYKSAITGMIRANDFSKFPDLKTLEGKKVLISGKVVDYKGSPEVTIDSPDDIKIIK